MAELPVSLLREALAAHGQVCVTAMGQSMGPALPNGSLVTITAGPVPYLGLVALVYGETLVIHRVWRRQPLRTRGDTAKRWDPPGGIPLGVVRRVRPPGRPEYDPNQLRRRVTAALWAAGRRVRRGW